MTQCINCYRCVHICEQLQGQFVWKIHLRGDDTSVIPDSHDGTLLHSSCVSCGACVDSCPTGALEDKTLLENNQILEPERWVRTTCPYCGTGCELNVGVSNDQISVVRPVLDAPVSKGHLCVKGRYGFGYVDSTERVTEPMLKRNDHWSAVTWDEALNEIAQVLNRLRSSYGSNSIGVLASSRVTNEESYLAQKFARVVLGTNNIDCCARVCHTPSAAALSRVFGAGAATNSFDDIERTQGFLIIGSNTTENHSIVGARIKQRALAGVPVIVIDPRRTELARYAAIHLAPKPGTNVVLLNAIAQTIISEKLIDKAFIEARTVGFDEYALSLDEWTPECAAPICELDPEAIRRAALLYAQAKPAMSFHGLGVTEQIQGTDGVAAIANLAMLTGNLGIPGAGVNPLRGQNNVQGTATMGCEPDKLTGSQSIEGARHIHEGIWKSPLPASQGLDLMKMLEAAEDGSLKAMVAIGYDLLLTSPNMHLTASALSRLEAVVVIDLFMTETAKQFGTVFFPAASSFEKDGTFMNAERRIQRVRKAVSVRGQAKTDSDILCLLAERMGYKSQFSFPTIECVWDEIRRLWPAAQGITYSRLSSGGIQWPCPFEGHAGTEVLHQSAFASGARAPFRPIRYSATQEQSSGEYPFLLNTGRSLYHFNAATMSGRTRNRELSPDDLIEINPDDAAEYKIKDNTPVSVESRYGAFTGCAHITNSVRRGHLFTTFHNVAAQINQVTGSGRDRVTHTPEYKVTAVRIHAQ